MNNDISRRLDSLTRTEGGIEPSVLAPLRGKDVRTVLPSVAQLLAEREAAWASIEQQRLEYAEERRDR